MAVQSVMPELSLSISFSTFVIVAAALLSAALSFFVYRVTIPPIPTRIRFFLVVLRTFGLFLLFLLTAEPVISLFQRTLEPPEILVLVDNSRSMKLKDRMGNRETQVHALLKSGAFERLSEIGAVRTVLFDAQPKPLTSFHPDSVTLSGDQTDLAGILRYCRTEILSGNIRSVVLISDGNATIGGSPLLEADTFPLPIFTLAIGDSSEQRDLFVRKVLTNTVAYSGTRIPVNVHIVSSGFAGNRVEVILKNAGKILDRQILQLQEGTREYGVKLTFAAGEEGRQEYTVEVSELPGEVTGKNNRSTFFVKILKSKVNVLLVAGGPGPDVAFVRRHLEQDQNVEVTTLIEREAGRMYEEAPTTQLLAKQECVVLIGIPGKNTSSATLKMILDAAEEGKGLFFIASRTLDVTKLRTLESILPVSIQGTSGEEIQAFFHVPEFRRPHALLKVSAGSENWSRLPPLFTLRTFFRIKPESEVLAVSRVQTVVTNEPLFAVRNVNQRKSAALLGYGLWRWQMLPEGYRHFEHLLGNVVRWLTVREDTRRIRIEPSEEVFTTQDPVEFSGQVYDESMQPVDDARLSVVITGNGERNELSLTPLGNGQYQGRLGPLAAGDYGFAATIHRNGNELAAQRGTFSIGGVNAEFLETRTNSILLRQLAARTGGAFVRPEELPAAIQSLPDFQVLEVTRSDQFELWNLQWSLSLLVAIFSLEWFIRKRIGML